MGATMARRRQKQANLKRAEAARIKMESQPQAPAAPEQKPEPKLSHKGKGSKK